MNTTLNLPNTNKRAKVKVSSQMQLVNRRVFHYTYCNVSRSAIPEDKHQRAVKGQSTERLALGIVETGLRKGLGYVRKYP